MGYFILFLGALALGGFLLAMGTSGVQQAADAMIELESVSGNTVAEAYYQAVGRVLKGALLLGVGGVVLFVARVLLDVWRDDR